MKTHFHEFVQWPRRNEQTSCRVFQQLQRKLSSIPDFVAEKPVALHAKDIQVDVTTLSGIGAEGEPQSVGSTLRDSIGEIFSLKLQNKIRAKLQVL